LSAETLEKVYIALTFEPQTPNEIAEKIDLNQHTVQGALLELMNTKKISSGRRSGGTGYG
jgi:predicted transcriptional regulator